MGFRCFSIFYLILLSSPIFTLADTLRLNQPLQDGQTLVSSGQRFELGFFSIGNSSNRYLGIWYKNLPLTVVWVANRNNPIVGFSGSLALNSNGISLSSNSSSNNWSINSTKTVTAPALELLESGNLVLREENSDSNAYIWQSFDDITDTLLPEMKLGWNLQTGLRRNMTSWSTADDPSNGQFTFSLDSPETPQLVVRKESEEQYRWGPWDGVRFSGTNELKSNPIFTPMFNSSLEEVFFSYKTIDNTALIRLVVTQEGLIQYITWSENSKEWVIMVTLQGDSCDRYGTCGPYGICDSYPNCKCLKGFEPKSPQDWERFDPSSGCVRKWEVSCGNGDGFVKYMGLKLPDNSFLAANRTMSLEECEAECLKNCSCMAFSRLDIHGNGGNCVMWSGDLVDMKKFPDGDEELYIRMAREELKSIADAKKRRKVKVAITVVMSIVSGMLLFGVIAWFIIRRRRAKREEGITNNAYQEREQATQEEDLELPLFSLDIISVATNDFSFANKVGEGGFGPVYKGVLPSGQEIAVKRLSQSSGQGILEFKNEVILIAKLQHRNLVKLLGCCIQGGERMLVYEYLSNGSLYSFLFDQTGKKLLKWKRRLDIIMGIARGLLYLHQDSRLRIIHRDLKASNILLDIEMNPKISDFGIARIFGEQTEEKTKRVIGTYGYMSPEYAMSGFFSVKSDVFSFGVLLLEIVSGKKNWGFYHPDHDLNLLGHTWKLWNEGNPLDLLDAAIEGSFSANEVIRCIKVGLLCVQQRVEDRPTMSSVSFMLGNETSLVPEPKEPGFSTEVSFFGTDTSSSGKNPHTDNKLTITALDGR